MADKQMERVAKFLRQAEDAEKRANDTSLSESARQDARNEHDAYMEKALVLSQAHSIDLAIARAHQAKKERVEEPERRTYTVGETGGRRSQRAKFSHYVDLALAIGRANDLQGALIASDSTYVSMVGMPSDHEMTERMFSILAVQMVSEADALLKAGANKVLRRRPKRVRVEIPEEERAWGKPDYDKDGKHFDFYYDEPGEVYKDQYLPLGKELGQRDHPDNLVKEIYDDQYWDERGYRFRKPRIPPTHKLVNVTDDEGNVVYEEQLVSSTDGRVWRANFYKGFVSEIEARLREAKKRALREAGVDLADITSEKGIALRDKAKEVKDKVEEDEYYVLATKKIESGKSSGYGGAEVSREDWIAQDKGREAGQNAATGNERDLREG